MIEGSVSNILACRPVAHLHIYLELAEELKLTVKILARLYNAEALVCVFTVHIYGTVALLLFY